MATLVVTAALLTGCGDSPAREPDPTPAPATLPAIAAEPSPFPREWLDEPTWARLSAVEHREREAMSSRCPPLDPDEVRTRAPLHDATCSGLLQQVGILALVFDGTAPPRRPLSIDLELDAVSAMRIDRTRATCAPFLRALRDADVRADVCGRGERGARLPGQAVPVEAWALAHEGRIPEAARLLARALAIFAALSRTSLAEALPVMANIEPAIALLDAWAPGLDASARAAVRDEIHLAAASLLDLEDALRIDLLDRAERARADAEGEGSWSAIEWELSLAMLERVDASPDAGLGAMRADWRRRSAADAANPGPRPSATQRFAPEHRRWMMLSREGAVLDQLERQVRMYRQSSEPLRSFAAGF